MSSRNSAPGLDWAAGLPTTAEDVAALRSAADAPMSPAEYLRFVSQLQPSHETLRLRPIFKGEPFTLDESCGSSKWEPRE